MGNPRPTIKHYLLRDTQLRVARAGRQVQHQHVQTAPFHLVQELLERLHDHQAAPDYGRIFIYEVAHRHGLDAVVC
jgi:hypothetical protein